ncbi:hypothetical protein ADUPG1_009221 [Aduncisulcus paluster]|uniref:Uncharacterized protein n=1 Tax=Aduncisulcus paluster TaxID=2918883 RepID=A0ABQ5KUT6_9EUKA|nr:hypothetical protein ADUPG1_009221 [Aduncisulcus paluster]
MSNEQVHLLVEVNALESHSIAYYDWNVLIHSIEDELQRDTNPYFVIPAVIFNPSPVSPCFYHNVNEEGIHIYRFLLKIHVPEVDCKPLKAAYRITKDIPCSLDTFLHSLNPDPRVSSIFTLRVTPSSRLPFPVVPFHTSLSFPLSIIPKPSLQPFSSSVPASSAFSVGVCNYSSLVSVCVDEAYVNDGVGMVCVPEEIDIDEECCEKDSDTLQNSFFSVKKCVYEKYLRSKSDSNEGIIDLSDERSLFFLPPQVCGSFYFSRDSLQREPTVKESWKSIESLREGYLRGLEETLSPTPNGLLTTACSETFIGAPRAGVLPSSEYLPPKKNPASHRLSRGSKGSIDGLSASEMSHREEQHLSSRHFQQHSMFLQASGSSSYLPSTPHNAHAKHLSVTPMGKQPLGQHQHGRTSSRFSSVPSSPTLGSFPSQVSVVDSYSKATGDQIDTMLCKHPQYPLLHARLTIRYNSIGLSKNPPPSSPISFCETFHSCPQLNCGAPMVSLGSIQLPSLTGDVDLLSTLAMAEMCKMQSPGFPSVGPTKISSFSQVEKEVDSFSTHRTQSSNISIHSRDSSHSDVGITAIDGFKQYSSLSPTSRSVMEPQTGPCSMPTHVSEDSLGTLSWYVKKSCQNLIVTSNISSILVRNLARKEDKKEGFRYELVHKSGQVWGEDEVPCACVISLPFTFHNPTCNPQSFSLEIHDAESQGSVLEEEEIGGRSQVAVPASLASSMAERHSNKLVAQLHSKSRKPQYNSQTWHPNGSANDLFHYSSSSIRGDKMNGSSSSVGRRSLPTSPFTPGHSRMASQCLPLVSEQTLQHEVSKFKSEDTEISTIPVALPLTTTISGLEVSAKSQTKIDLIYFNEYFHFLA